MSIHIFLDIEALGKRPGCNIIELGAVAFFSEKGEILEEFHALIEPQPPFFVEWETMAWHAERETWPRRVKENQELHAVGSALALFEDWIHGIRSIGWEQEEPKGIEAFWSWGSTYDFPRRKPPLPAL